MRGLSTALYAGLLAGAVLVGLYFRAAHLASLTGHALPLSSDAQSYYDEAVELQRRVAAGASPAILFFSGATWFREPLYVFSLAGWLSLVGPGEANAVTFSLGASLAWLAASGVAAGALLGRATGTVTAYLLALDSLWIRNSTNGLREELTGFFLVVAVALLWLRPTRRAALLWLPPLCVAAAGMTRLDALPFGLFTLIWAAVAQRWRPTRVLACAGVLLVILLPVFQGYARSRGDAFPSSAIIATANWREEFKDRMGTPGYEWDRFVTPAEYLFSYHSPPTLAWYTARGVYRIFARETFQSLYYALAGGSMRVLGGAGKFAGLESPYLAPTLFAAGVIGLVAQWSRWRTHWLPIALCVVGVLPPIGFIAGVPQDWLYQVRYGYMASPFANAILSWAVTGATASLAALLARAGQRRLRPAVA